LSIEVYMDMTAAALAGILSNPSYPTFDCARDTPDAAGMLAAEYAAATYKRAYMQFNTNWGKWQEEIMANDARRRKEKETAGEPPAGSRVWDEAKERWVAAEKLPAVHTIPEPVEDEVNDDRRRVSIAAKKHRAAISLIARIKTTVASFTDESRVSDVQELCNSLLDQIQQGARDVLSDVPPSQRV
jgi:hypothetical protein